MTKGNQKYRKRDNVELEMIAYDIQTTMMTNAEVSEKWGFSDSGLSNFKNTKRFQHAMKVVGLRVDSQGLYMENKL